MGLLTEVMMHTARSLLVSYAAVVGVTLVLAVARAASLGRAFPSDRYRESVPWPVMSA